MRTWLKHLIYQINNLIIVKEPNTDTGNYSLEVMLDDAQQALKNAHNRFAIANDPDLIDYAIYSILASEKRYQYILKQIKHESGLSGKCCARGIELGREVNI